MQRHRYRLPRAPRRRSPLFRVVQRDGRAVARVDGPVIEWSDRGGVAFSSEEAAKAFVKVRLASAVRTLGIRVVAA